MSDYKINEKDIDSVIEYLKHHDPANADKEYAVQLLYSMQETAKELVNQNVEFAELLELTLKKRS